jgi:hypothetical protein
VSTPEPRLKRGVGLGDRTVYTSNALYDALLRIQTQLQRASLSRVSLTETVGVVTQFWLDSHKEKS